MKIIKRTFLGLVLGLATIAIGGVSFVRLALPHKRAASTEKIVATPERLARGEYLAHHVALCLDCHSRRDMSTFPGPVIPGTVGKGGERFDEVLGIPGRLYAPNITPAGIGNWTDGEVIRAMTEGVSRDGRPLFPLMPYQSFRNMSEEDARSIIAYLRTIPAVPNQVPVASFDFPLNLIVRTGPAPADLPKAAPDPGDEVAYGGYLVKMASCADCHSRMEKGEKVKGMEFAGGAEFHLPGGATLRSANITPDEETGIGLWNRETFIQRFRSVREKPATDGFVTLMPWSNFQGMTDKDLGSIYAYLRTVKPVRNEVVRFTSPAHVQSVSNLDQTRAKTE